MARGTLTSFLLFSLLLVLSATAEEKTDSALFTLRQVNDTLHVLELRSKGQGTGNEEQVSKWPLPYPVYQFQTGDVDGDGKTDAMVGVIKSTRYFPEKGRRLFIFKNYEGHVRALWLGSRLGGILQDFRYVDGIIRSLETTTDNRYVVAEYQWEHFGMSFRRFLAKNVSREEALLIFNQ